MDVVASGNLEMLDQILNIPSVDLQSAKKFNGQNVLHLAASFGQSSAVEKLLQVFCLIVLIKKLCNCLFFEY